MAQGFLLKYAEIGVKGKNRYKFEDALCDQIRLRLSFIDGDFTVQKESGRAPSLLDNIQPVIIHV